MKNRYYTDYRRLRKALAKNDTPKVLCIIDAMVKKYGANISSTISYAIDNKEVRT